MFTKVMKKGKETVINQLLQLVVLSNQIVWNETVWMGIFLKKIKKRQQPLKKSRQA